MNGTKICAIDGCGRRYKARGLCGPHYAAWFRSSPPGPKVWPSIEERFWANVDRRSENECWEWAAKSKTPAGYGVFHPRKPETVGAHRFSLALHLGRPITTGMFACHTCDNPPCVNPHHLYEGTSQNNVDDAVSRQRHKRGEMDPNAKLSEDDVLAIRFMVADGAKSRSAAAIYGVQESLISGIVRGNRWQHVGGPITKHYKRKAA